MNDAERRARIRAWDDAERQRRLERAVREYEDAMAREPVDKPLGPAMRLALAVGLCAGAVLAGAISVGAVLLFDYLVKATR